MVPTNVVQAGRRSVLVVEDDHDIRVALRNMLEDEGYHVDTATDGRSALQVLEAAATRPDLILLDLMLPVMDGWELARELRARPHLAAIPIVVITAFDRVPPPQAAAILKKPLVPDHLLRTIARHVH